MAESTMEEVLDVEGDLKPCGICGRTFLPKPLSKHMRVCERNATRRRKIFDSLKQRVEGTELAPFHQRSYLKKHHSTTTVTNPEANRQSSKWREKHLELVNTIRAARGVPVTMPLSPKRVASNTTPAGGERCPSCDRQFGPRAFDRHVEWCKEHKARIQRSPAEVLLAKERLEARTKYRVPLPNKSKRALVKDKYSPTISGRSDSVTSLKSSSTVSLDRSPSIRKPKSLHNLKKVHEEVQHEADDRVHAQLPKKREESSITQQAKEKYVPKEPKGVPVIDSSKSPLPSRSTKLKQKLNTTEVNSTVEGMIVSSMMVDQTGNQSKRLVTWKDTVCNSSHATCSDKSAGHGLNMNMVKKAVKNPSSDNGGTMNCNDGSVKDLSARSERGFFLKPGNRSKSNLSAQSKSSNLSAQSKCSNLSAQSRSSNAQSKSTKNNQNMKYAKVLNLTLDADCSHLPSPTNDLKETERSFKSVSRSDIALAIDIQPSKIYQEEKVTNFCKIAANKNETSLEQNLIEPLTVPEFCKGSTAKFFSEESLLSFRNVCGFENKFVGKNCAEKSKIKKKVRNTYGPDTIKAHLERNVSEVQDFSSEIQEKTIGKLSMKSFRVIDSRKSVSRKEKNVGNLPNVVKPTKKKHSGYSSIELEEENDGVKNCFAMENDLGDISNKILDTYQASTENSLPSKSGSRKSVSKKERSAGNLANVVKPAKKKYSGYSSIELEEENDGVKNCFAMEDDLDDRINNKISDTHQVIVENPLPSKSGQQKININKEFEADSRKGVSKKEKNAGNLPHVVKAANKKHSEYSSNELEERNHEAKNCFTMEDDLDDRFDSKILGTYQTSVENSLPSKGGQQKINTNKEFEAGSRKSVSKKEKSADNLHNLVKPANKKLSEYSSNELEEKNHEVRNCFTMEDDLDDRIDTKISDTYQASVENSLPSKSSKQKINTNKEFEADNRKSVCKKEQSVVKPTNKKRSEYSSNELEEENNEVKNCFTREDDLDDRIDTKISGTYQTSVENSLPYKSYQQKINTNKEFEPMSYLDEVEVIDEKPLDISSEKIQVDLYLTDDSDFEENEKIKMYDSCNLRDSNILHVAQEICSREKHEDTNKNLQLKIDSSSGNNIEKIRNVEAGSNFNDIIFDDILDNENSSIDCLNKQTRKIKSREVDQNISAFYQAQLGDASFDCTNGDYFLENNENYDDNGKEKQFKSTEISNCNTVSKMVKQKCFSQDKDKLKVLQDTAQENKELKNESKAIDRTTSSTSTSNNMKSPNTSHINSEESETETCLESLINYPSENDIETSDESPHFYRETPKEELVIDDENNQTIFLFTAEENTSKIFTSSLNDNSVSDGDGSADDVSRAFKYNFHNKSGFFKLDIPVKTNKSSTVSVLHPPQEVSDVESLSCESVDDWNEALSIARIDLTTRKCASAVYSRSNKNSSFLTYTELDLTKFPRCDVQSTKVVPHADEQLTTDEILEIAGEAFLSSFRGEEEAQSVHLEEVPITSSSEYIPAKRRRLNDIPEDVASDGTRSSSDSVLGCIYEDDLALNLERIKFMKRKTELDENARYDFSKNEKLDSGTAHCEGDVCIGDSDKYKSIGIQENFTLMDSGDNSIMENKFLELGGNRLETSTLKCDETQVIHSASSNSFVSDLSPRLQSLIELLLADEKQLPNNRNYSSEDLLTISKELCKKLLALDPRSVNFLNTLKLPFLEQHKKQSPKMKKGETEQSALSLPLIEQPKKQQPKMQKTVPEGLTVTLPPIEQCKNQSPKVQKAMPEELSLPPISKIPVVKEVQGKKQKNILLSKYNEPLPNIPSTLSASDKQSDYNPFVTAERQLMELLECDDFKPFFSKSSTPQHPQRPHTTANSNSKPNVASKNNKVVKSAENIRKKLNFKSGPNSKRSSVIDPPLDFQDQLHLLSDDFELIESLINQNYIDGYDLTNDFNLDNISSKLSKNFYLHSDANENEQRNNVAAKERKYSDDLSAIDPSLINEQDNLSIPENLKIDDYSSHSSNDNIMPLITNVNNKNEPKRATKKSAVLEKMSHSLDESSSLTNKTTNKQINRNKNLIKTNKQPGSIHKSTASLTSSYGIGRHPINADKKKNLAALKRSVSLVDPVKPKNLKNKQDVQNYFNQQEKKNSTKAERTSPDRQLQRSPKMEVKNVFTDQPTAEELFSVDDEMYEEYKRYEAMYLQEKQKQMQNEKIDELISSGTLTPNESSDNVPQNIKVSGDSAYSSLNRKAPKVRARSTKLAPLEHQKSQASPIGSPTSSGSETSLSFFKHSASQRMSKFCHECGNKYPINTAKFCVECGVKRLVL